MKTRKKEQYFDVIIVGAGIAGMTAAIYVKRAGKSVLILERKMHGGQIIQTSNIANWPGELSISGAELSEKIYHQVNKLGIEMKYEEVVSVEKMEEVVSGKSSEVGLPIWLVKTDEDNYVCSAIIIATGTEDKAMGVPREKELVGNGVSYCATCDGAFYKNKTVVVVGGGNSALYEALYLADLAEKVYLVHRRDKFRADAVLVEKASAKDNIEFLLESRPVELLGEKKVEGLVVEDVVGASRELIVEGVFVAVGRVPATNVFNEVVSLDDGGYIIAGEDCKTSAPGIFVAGDCRVKTVRQLITAASDGAVAASAVGDYLA